MAASTQSPLLSVADAQAAMAAAITPAEATETVTLAQAVGRYVARPIAVRSPHPAFTNSSMDGYALRAAEATRPLPIVGEARAGDAPGRLPPGGAWRILTGAPLPEGADAVIMQEEVEREGDTLHTRAPVCVGQNIRRMGEDLRPGQVLYDTGFRVRPMDLALLAAAGHGEVTVWRRPRVLVFATGDELANPGDPLAAGQVYESNRLTTLASLASLGAEALDGGLIPDRRSEIEAKLAQTRDCDFVVTSGGVSVGDYDFVKEALAPFGETRFWRVRIKPGKPIAFARLHERTHFFGLPGNPVSSLVTFQIFVVPAIAAWHHARSQPGEITAAATHDFTRRAGRMEFLRATLTWSGGTPKVALAGGQGSHELGPLAMTNALARLDEDSTGFREGDSLSVIPLTLESADILLPPAPPPRH